MKPNGRTRTERGSALMLAPAGILVLIALGAISVDSAVAFAAQRELSSQATAAVNDAVTLSLSDAELQRGAEARIDPVVATRIVQTRLLSMNYSGLAVAPEGIAVSVSPNDGTISVVVEGDAEYIFSKAIPGARDRAHVKVLASARLQHRAG